MNIIVLSDTHMPRMAKKFPPALLTYLHEADAIIHVGDWQTEAIADDLTKFAPLYGVTGNVDEPALHQRFQKSLLLSFGSLTVGVTHGDGKGKTTEQRAMDQFKNIQPDLLLFGHSHIPVYKKINGTILFNPGSPTDKRKQKQFSFGHLQINEDEWSIKHVFFDSKT
ncbi:metallophosphoesterase family protein [Jeotgalibacillus campisalis]|uniref:Phosphoesterase n=1 Tax=Jeotgalibacillus campisalis TaxID=220754 RepID=A0A0C2S518_9BACL|nr:metallophosphoesterase [Jeotgalibacillus campisalis]KIL49109.1 phosphodiesterase [Jeotgalibacillus campisalis]